MGISNDKVEKRKWRLLKLLSLRQGTLLFYGWFPEWRFTGTTRCHICCRSTIKWWFTGHYVLAQLRSRAKSVEILTRHKNLCFVSSLEKEVQRVNKGLRPPEMEQYTDAILQLWYNLKAALFFVEDLPKNFSKKRVSLRWRHITRKYDKRKL